MTVLELTCECGDRLTADVRGSATIVCSSCSSTWLVGVGMLTRPAELELGDLVPVFPAGRHVAHVDVGDGRSACGLELAGTQLALVEGFRTCAWCVAAGGARAAA